MLPASPITTETTIKWYINNTSGVQHYIGPDCLDHSFSKDTWDLWAGTTRIYNNRPCKNGAMTFTDLKFLFDTGTATIKFDDIVITNGEGAGGAFSQPDMPQIAVEPNRTATDASDKSAMKIYVPSGQNMVDVFYRSAVNDQVKVSIINLWGAKIAERWVPVASGTNQILIPATLNGGMYVVQLVNNTGVTFVKKFVK